MTSKLQRIIGTGLIFLATTGIYSCKSKEEKAEERYAKGLDKPSVTTTTTIPKTYSFNGFNEIKTEGVDSDSKFEVKDMNGDGALDIIIFDAYHDKIFIYENKIPQKNKQ